MIPYSIIYGSSAATVRKASGPSPAGAHKFWRLRVLQIQDWSGDVVLNRLWFFDRDTHEVRSVNGTPITGGQLRGSVTDPFNYASTNFGLYWAGNGVESWLGYEFSAPVKIGAFAVINKTQDAGKALKEVAVDYSDDGVVWQTAWTVIYDEWDGSAEFRKSIDPAIVYEGSRWGAHKFWRFTPIYNGANSMRVAELAWKASPLEANQAVGGTPSQSSTWSTQTADKAYDGSTSTFAETVSANFMSDWMQYEFANPVELESIGYTAQNSGNTPSRGIALWSDDGTTWHPAWGWTGASYSAGATTRLADPNFVHKEPYGELSVLNAYPVVKADAAMVSVLNAYVIVKGA